MSGGTGTCSPQGDEDAMTWRSTARTLAVLAAAVLTAACTGSRPPVTVESPAPRPAGLFVVADGAGRPMVIDGQGFTAYRFDGDAAEPSRSTCVSDCARRWPPVLWSADLRLAGIDRQLVGRLVHPDGTAQLTLAGWPLYGYSGDRMPGDVTGAGFDGQWWAVGPRGARLA
jgi:predicted lipoprotein with Yx(FWY)xxD motif